MIDKSKTLIDKSKSMIRLLDSRADIKLRGCVKIGTSSFFVSSHHDLTPIKQIDALLRRFLLQLAAIQVVPLFTIHFSTIH